MTGKFQFLGNYLIARLAGSFDVTERLCDDSFDWAVTVGCCRVTGTTVTVAFNFQVVPYLYQLDNDNEINRPDQGRGRCIKVFIDERRDPDLAPAVTRYVSKLQAVTPDLPPSLKIVTFSFMVYLYR